MEIEGKFVFVGLVFDLSGEDMIGEGLIIYRVVFLDEVCVLVDVDLMYKIGVCIYILCCWLVNEGSFLFIVGFLIKKLGFE